MVDGWFQKSWMQPNELVREVQRLLDRSSDMQQTATSQ